MTMTPQDDLIKQAEWYQKAGENLPADLYYSLLELGIDASLYNDNITDYDERNHHDDP